MNTVQDNLKQWLTRSAGVDSSRLEGEFVGRFMQQRQRQLGLDFNEYVSFVQRDAQELERLLAEICVPETRLFRYRQSYEFLADRLATLRVQSDAKTQLQLLSVACATGEEAYSMAITAAHAGWPIEQVRVVAIDRNPGFIALAQMGQYGRRTITADAPSWAGRWLQQEGDQLAVDPEIRSAVHFQVADVLRQELGIPGQYHAIFCRNLLIYLNQTSRNRIIDRLATWLQPHGLLFVGHAEPLAYLRSRFEPLTAPRTFALELTDPVKAASAETVAAPQKATLSVPPPLPPTIPPRIVTKTAPGGPEPSPSPNLEGIRALADAGRLEEALVAAESLLDKGGPTIGLCRLLGNLHLAQNNLPKAREALGKVIYLEPRDEETLLQLALVHERLGQPNLSESFRKRAARVHQQQRAEESP